MIGKRSDLGAATFEAVTKIRATFGKLTTKLKCTMFKKYYDILENLIELDNMYGHNTQQNVSQKNDNKKNDYFNKGMWKNGNLRLAFV